MKQILVEKVFKSWIRPHPLQSARIVCSVVPSQNLLKFPKFVKNNILVSGYRCGKLGKWSLLIFWTHLFGPIDSFTPDIWTATLKKNVYFWDLVFGKIKNTGENRSRNDVLELILTDLSQDTTRKSKFFTMFRADTSREIEDSIKKCCFFQTFLQKGSRFEFCEGYLWFKVLQNVDFSGFWTFCRVHFLIFCVGIPLAGDLFSKKYRGVHRKMYKKPAKIWGGLTNLHLTIFSSFYGTC